MENIESILNTVAEHNGVSVEEVKREIQTIIDDLYDSDDPAIESKWHCMTENGQKPSIEQLILYCVKRVDSKSKPVNQSKRYS